MALSSHTDTVIESLAAESKNNRDNTVRVIDVFFASSSRKSDVQAVLVGNFTVGVVVCVCVTVAVADECRPDACGAAVFVHAAQAARSVEQADSASNSKGLRRRRL
jgi:hypothetical protein